MDCSFADADADADVDAPNNNDNCNDGFCNDLSPSIRRSASYRQSSWPLDSQRDDATESHSDETTTAVSMAKSLHENNMKGVLSKGRMANVGSDEWTNFIVIDDGISQESFANSYYYGLNGNIIFHQSMSSMMASPTIVTDFASTVVEEADTNNNESTIIEPSKQQVTKEVCRLLGLPRDIAGSHHRKQGNIMSSNTEQKLRELIHRGEDQQRKSSFAFTADKFPPDGSSGPLLAPLEEKSTAGEEDSRSRHRNNILMEGEYYLAMSMLVYIYALLREASMLGHTVIAFDEVDVNSVQSNAYCRPSSYLDNTKSAGFIIRVVMDELEKNGSFGSVGQNEGDLIVMKEFQRLVMDSRIPQDAATEETMKQLRRKVARRRWKRAISAVRLIVRLGKSRIDASMQKVIPLKSAPHQLNAKESQQVTRDKTTPHHGWREQTVTDKSIKNVTSSKSFNSISSAVRDIAHDALDEPSFFRDGSLMGNLIESGIEVVYFDDRHPNDVVYSICCNRRYKRVSVVFRGTVNSHNMRMNMKFAMAEHPNPITKDYPGREDMLGLHTGFSIYMTRQRKNDNLTKIEEIFSNIDSIGRELAPDGNYELTITGHSLGGALATILSFYAATSNVFANVKTIRAFTYAAPRVGCQRFVHAFQHLERIGKLRLARFSNTRDIVPLVPFWTYKHVGVHVRLHGVNKFAQYWLRQALDVTYPKHHGLWSQIWRGLRSSLMMNLNTIQGYMRCHTLSEYQRRIHFAHKYRSALSLTDFFRCKKRNRLKTLDEYYFIKGASSESGTATLTKIFLEDREKESDRRKARTIMAFLLLIVLMEAAVLLNIFTARRSNEKYSAKIDDAPEYQRLFDFTIKSFPTSVFSSRNNFATFMTDKDMHVVDSATKLSMALPYIRGHGYRPRHNLLWGIRLQRNKIPSNLQVQTSS